MNSRGRLLQEWAGYIIGASEQGAIPAIQCIDGIAGPRAGALEISAGLEAGALLRAFAKNDSAMARQFIPWSFPGDPQVFMAGRFGRVEAGWPDHLAETLIRLSDLGKNPKRGGWIAEKNERGRTVAPRLDDRTPHFLVSGATGSGKSVALRNAVLQLSRDPANRLALIDGKYGESLNQVAHLRGVVGPVAVDGAAIRGALGWACQEMRRQYEQGCHNGRVVVVFDEIQEFADDQVVVALMQKIASQGRAAHVHLMCATQHPTVSAFGDPKTRRSLTGKLALRVEDPDASRVAVGGNLPRADFLLGAGDCYAVGSGTAHRIQGAYVDQRDFAKAETGAWDFETWPDYQAEAVGQDLPTNEVNWSYSGAELAVSIVSASEGEGRPAMVNRLEAADLGRPGSVRAARLLTLGREAHCWLEDNDYFIGH